MSLQAIFCPTGVSSLLWFIPLPLLFQDCAVHTCPRGPASALFIRGGLGPNRHNHGAGSQAVSLGVVTWPVEKSKKVRGVHLATPC